MSKKERNIEKYELKSLDDFSLSDDSTELFKKRMFKEDHDKDKILKDIKSLVVDYNYPKVAELHVAATSEQVLLKEKQNLLKAELEGAERVLAIEEIDRNESGLGLWASLWNLLRKWFGSTNWAVNLLIAACYIVLLFASFSLTVGLSDSLLLNIPVAFLQGWVGKLILSVPIITSVFLLKELLGSFKRIVAKNPTKPHKRGVEYLNCIIVLVGLSFFALWFLKYRDAINPPSKEDIVEIQGMYPSGAKGQGVITPKQAKKKYVELKFHEFILPALVVEAVGLTVIPYSWLRRRRQKKRDEANFLVVSAMCLEEDDSVKHDEQKAEMYRKYIGGVARAYSALSKEIDETKKEKLILSKLLSNLEETIECKANLIYTAYLIEVEGEREEKQKEEQKEAEEQQLREAAEVETKKRKENAEAEMNELKEKLASLIAHMRPKNEIQQVEDQISKLQIL